VEADAAGAEHGGEQPRRRPFAPRREGRTRTAAGSWTAGER
jgi:hypothetical protein